VSGPVASLPMYDWPEVRWANDALWAAIRDRLRAAGIDAPDTLDRERPSGEVWRDPALVLSQTCGYPYATALRGHVRIVGTSAYEAEGCAGPFYSSVLVARANRDAGALAAFRGERFAFNSRDSLSGYVVLRQAMQAEGLADSAVRWVETGSHRGSVLAVAEGRADLAAIDAVCWALATRREPDAAARLRVIATTPLRPGLPLITAGHRGDAGAEAIRAAVSDALRSPDTLGARQALFLVALESLDQGDYAALEQLGGEPEPTGP